MGLSARLGRVTNSHDDGPAAPPVSVLTQSSGWSTSAAIPRVVGRTIRINDMVSTIVGVAQREPHYPRRTDVFVNMVTSPHHLSATMKRVGRIG